MRDTITIDYLEAMKAHMWDIFEDDNEIIIFFMNGADDDHGGTFSWEDSETFPNTTENLTAVVTYFVRKLKPHLTCNECGYKQYDEATVIAFIVANPDAEPHDIYYICGACLDVDNEKRAVVGRNYDKEE